MAKISKKSLTILVVLSSVLLILGLRFVVNQPPIVAKDDSVEKLPSRAKGNPQAHLQIIEFIDFQCPACAKGYQLLDDYLKKNPDKIYLELRYFPLAMHRHGLLSARVAECVSRQEKFWPFMDLLLLRQSQWAAMIDPMSAFEQIAKETGVDKDQLTECLKDSTVEKAIQADVEEGKMRAVVSTPTYFVNHEMVVGTKSLQTRLEEFSVIKVLRSQEKP